MRKILFSLSHDVFKLLQLCSNYKVINVGGVMTTTDPLRGSLIRWYYLQAALIRSCGASFACMELTTIRRFQRLAVTTLHQISIQTKFI